MTVAMTHSILQVPTRQIGWLFVWLDGTGLLAGWLVWLSGWFGCLGSLLDDWLAGWLAGWAVCWTAGWLVGWLADQLSCQLDV